MRGNMRFLTEVLHQSFRHQNLRTRFQQSAFARFIHA